MYFFIQHVTRQYTMMKMYIDSDNKQIHVKKKSISGY